MGIDVTLRRGDGPPLCRLPDPNGGTFDAAGDFDALLGASDLPVLGTIHAYGDTTFDGAQMATLIAEVDSALSRTELGPQARGLRRLRAMAEMCQADESLILHFCGD